MDANYIEWENIPITLRCTCREKINPNYPANFWQLEPKGTPPTAVVGRKQTDSQSKYLPAITELLSQGEATVNELGKALGVRPICIPSLLGGLSHNVLIYEYVKGGRKYMGLLDKAS